MSDEVQQIKDKIDVAELVGEYVQLKPAGTNKKGLCPFHHEKSPSFMVSPERQSWHCFGCAKSGDIFSFVQEIEGMDFREALKYLANKAGVPLSNSYHQEISSSLRNRLKDINKEAARFFYNFLIKMPTAKPAMDYLLGRGIKPATIDEWQIGFIPDQWDLLTQYLLKKGFGVDDLVASGLTIKKETGGFYDRFRGRIMFPIWDIHGDVTGFTGRVLVETDKSGGKYVNTPQTALYDKSRVIFGLNKAKAEIRAQNLVVIVEGQMDTIACHQAGMKNAVASSGTALTEEQVKLLKRYSCNINMAFDMDEAGQNAAKRGINLAIKEGLSVKVIRLPDGAGKDPDECLKKNPAVWFEAVKNAQDVMQWYFSKVFKNKDLSNHHDKQKIVDELLPDIVLIPFAVERDHWLRELSSRIGVDVSVLREDISRVKTTKNSVPIIEVKGAYDASNRPTDLKVQSLLSLIFKFPELVTELFIPEVPESFFAGRFWPIYENIKRQYNDSGHLDASVLSLKEGETIKEVVDILSMQADFAFADYNLVSAKEEVKKLLASIGQENLKLKRKELQNQIEQAEKKGEKEKLGLLLEEFKKLK